MGITAAISDALVSAGVGAETAGRVAVPAVGPAGVAAVHARQLLTAVVVIRVGIERVVLRRIKE